MLEQMLQAGPEAEQARVCSGWAARARVRGRRRGARWCVCRLARLATARLPARASKRTCRPRTHTARASSPHLCQVIRENRAVLPRTQQCCVVPPHAPATDLPFVPHDRPSARTRRWCLLISPPMHPWSSSLVPILGSHPRPPLPAQQVIRENQVVVVVGETGSGKTTQMTQARAAAWAAWGQGRDGPSRLGRGGRRAARCCGPSSRLPGPP